MLSISMKVVIFQVGSAKGLTPILKIPKPLIKINKI